MPSFISKICSPGRKRHGSLSQRPNHCAEPGVIRRVAVIGAGAIGVSTAKFLAGEEPFTNVDVYEQQSSFGGAWIWSQPDGNDRPNVPQTDPVGPLDRVKLPQDDDNKPPIVLTPMYDNLETNIPHILMRFSEVPFPQESLVFPHRSTVLKYIEDYSEEIRHLVRFGQQVVDLRLSRSADGHDLWILRYKNVKTGYEQEEPYDAVAVANGHFAHVSIPNIEGIHEWNTAYPGSVKHAKYFRKAEKFANKKVIIVGNASSGIDIGSQIAGHCQKPLILCARSDPLFKMPAYAEHVQRPEIVEFLNPKLGNRAVKLADGSIEEDVDVVLFCTGYFLSFPFFRPDLQKELINTGYMVHGTYKHIFWSRHPTLAFLGLPNKVLPMPLGEAQAALLARVWSGRIDLPSKPIMQTWEHERWRETADMLKAKGKPCEPRHVEKAFLAMGPGQDTAYQNELIDWAEEARPGKGRKLPLKWTDREIWIRSQMAPMKKAYAELGDKKHTVSTVEDLGIDYEKFKAEQGAQDPKFLISDKPSDDGIGSPETKQA